MFRDLNVGQTFDFVDDAPSGLNSFYERCTKTGPRSYKWTNQHGTFDTNVGTVKVEVFHVEDAES